MKEATTDIKEMILMSCSLIFCVVNVLPIQSLGITTKSNKSIVTQEPQQNFQKLLMKYKKRDLVIKQSDLQTVFQDAACQNCLTCMQRTLKAHKAKPSIIKSDENSQNMIIENRYRRDKRDTELIFTPNEEKKLVKKRINNDKIHVTVTKYNIDGIVYALKVKEKNDNKVKDDIDRKDDPNTCQVYSVEKAYPCDIPDTDLIASAIMKKAKKRIKKSKTLQNGKPYFRNRDDDTQMSEGFVPSFEEIY